MTKYAPIILFVYNRPDHTRRTIESLRGNFLADESDLIVFSDGPKNSEDDGFVQEVRKYIRTIDGFKRVEIIERNENFGLSKSVISGVTDILKKYERAIVLEDDIVTSTFFLEYMNESLDLYENEPRVASIHGYIYPVKRVLPETFFIRGADCWGWATWKRAWDHFERDGRKLLHEIERMGEEKEFDFSGTYGYINMLKKQIAGANNSWAIRWYASAFVKNMLTLYPGVSLVRNIGHDKTGVHGNQGKFYDIEPSKRRILVNRIPVEENGKARKAIVDYFRSLKPPIWKRVIRKIRTWV